MRVDFNKILCTTDFSEFSNFSIPFGIALAEIYNARVVVCHVIDLPSSAMYGDIYFSPTDIKKQSIEFSQAQIERLIANRSVECESMITVGHTADEIVRISEEAGVDLVVSATHGRSGLRRLALGSVTERLMRTLSCPLLILQADESLRRTTNFNKIVVGCDFSADSQVAFDYGLSLAQEFQAELHLVHVIEPSGYKDLLMAPVLPGNHLGVELRDQLGENLAGMVPEDARHWCVPKTALLEGRAYEELIRYAGDQEIDLMILGTRGIGMVEKLLLGSTTDRVARHAPCPVLSVTQAVKSSAESES
jgi:nucleotide-binding universal stress UspA family protein